MFLLYVVGATHIISIYNLLLLVRLLDGLTHTLDIFLYEKKYILAIMYNNNMTYYNVVCNTPSCIFPLFQICLND